MAVNKALFLVLCVLAARQSSSSHWSYANTDWSVDYPTCGGDSQSPINLDASASVRRAIPQLTLSDYDVLFAEKLVLENNGHAAAINIPNTIRGTRPTVSGGLLQGVYEAQAVHIHWGSRRGVKGSEHTVNGQRYDAEMHILHKNVKYETLDEAQENEDGITVLAVMLNIVDFPRTLYPGLSKIFNKAPLVVTPGANATIANQLTLRHFLGDIDTRNFYAYQGSLTTPPCDQVVTWHLFPNALEMPRILIQKFFRLKQEDGTPLVNNNRPLQPLNGRTIYRH